MNGGSIFPTIFIGLFVLIGLGILGYALRSMHFSKQAAHWPTSPGEIISSDFKVSSDDDGTTYHTKVAYTYSVNGQPFTGKRIAFGYTGSSGRNFHREIFDALPIKTTLAVRYDPENPERAALSYGVNKSILFLLIFGLIWTLFSTGLGALFIMGEGGAERLLSNMLIYDRP